ncbi:Helix-turn-helix domain protein [compost metagenome]
MGVECRTIQRRLADDGQRFSAVVNEVRKELAARHVLGSDRPLAEVAGLLGFCAPSGLSRWFHAQYGRSAKESRAQRRVPRDPSSSRD